MFLHKDESIFRSIVREIRDEKHIDEAIIEKDYYVTLFLKHLSRVEPLLIFKGGTCLSKCYKLIKRFSEDIDINLESVRSLTQSRRKMLRDHIVETTAELGLKHINPEAIKSGRDYNNYHIEYPTMFSRTILKQYLQVEAVFRIETFPTQKMNAVSLIYDYLKANGHDNIIKQYELEPFEVRVQTLERTFVDKVFALGTYYINDRVPTHSRHLYDLYKMFPHIRIDSELLKLFDMVRYAWKNRMGSHDTSSAEDFEDLHSLLHEVIDKNIYKDDYKNITVPLLYENVSYADTIETLEKIIVSLEKVVQEQENELRNKTNIK
ncbi:MAG: nucleotidyl transferase AbiEii/AbiGii toxin family protein [Bacillales bacterium]|jgi:predicted nucleotidyltransferase component of viral defense system|nr:nucleotidyl transferase AbiEii/AbiGii toxin family protein [Bacillales bacterium]